MLEIAETKIKEKVNNLAEIKAQRYNRNLLLFIAVVSFVSLAYGWFAYFNGMAVYSVISYPFIWLGLFVWGDAMILGSFLFIGSLVLLKKNNYVLTGLFFSAYYMIRSFIEAMYNLNAQFSPISRPWEAFIPGLAAKLNFRLQEMFVVPQILYTAVCITALMVFLTFLKKYLKD